ncbi:MAG: AtpZ/AtpI family protein [Candidatus Omnitrophica bacterium]|nr:AtpZ/AtpI family protein [Candidatus Omnitrophota bacterium]
MQLGLVIVVCILVGLGIGIFLDNFFKTKGVFLVIFLIMGIIAGFKNVYTEVMKNK